MDYSRMGGVKPTYGKNKPRLGEEKGPSKDARNDKAKLLERMKNAAEAAKAQDQG